MRTWHSYRPSSVGTWIRARFVAVQGPLSSSLFSFFALISVLFGSAIGLPAAAQSAATPAPVGTLAPAPVPMPTAPVISPQAQAALSHLLQNPAAAAPTGAGSGPPPMAIAAPQMSAGSRMQVVVRPGETLDRVIQRTLRDSPFRNELLRDAFVRLNRSAFPRGTPHWLLAGSVLQVPTPADLLLQVDPRWWPAPAQGAPVTPASTASQRRDWVRYP